ncbi:Putative beta-lactamase/transpeptidase [Septoria linicola]|uniref:Beta-lactamase/transpeptidase n=1 Tax=Septoria linicola TaxID=215465 RepID=A0A9Q9EKE0_9PEZI|nr:Putative beta-lactamase/transpeptidase [Septoria linicola]
MTAIPNHDSGTAPIIKHFNSSPFAQRVQHLLEEWHVPGLSIAITQDKESSSKGFGFATLDPKVPCTADTIFDIASSSKSLTAASVGLLVQDDEKYSNVQWDAKMSDLLPEDFVMSEDSYTRDTRRCLIRHRIPEPRYCQEKSKTFVLCKLQESPEAQGAGSIQTSVNNYIKWVRALMYHEGPIEKDLYEGLTRVRIFQDPEIESEDRHPLKSFTGYAAGLEVFYYRGYQVVGHDDLISGYGSRHFWLPELDFGAVLLGNAEGALYAIEVLAYELVDELLEIPQAQRTDWSARARESEEQLKSEMLEPVAKKLRPDLEKPEPQKVPLSSYAGDYWNAGYKGLKVELTDYWAGFGENEAAEFEFENGRVVKMGLKLESDFEDYIWFHRVGLREED